MRQNNFKIVVLIFVLCFFTNINSFAEEKNLLYINGEKSNIKPLIVNDSAMLPLRDVLEVVGCDSIQWDNTTKTATIVTSNMELKLTIGMNIAPSKYGLEDKIEWHLTQPPVVIEGRTYLPLRFISDVFFSDIKYENSTVFLNTPFKYVNGIWNESNYFKWKEVTINNRNIKKYDNTIYVMYTTERESLYVNPAAVFALNPQGNYKLISWLPALVSDYKVFNSNLFYQFNTSLLTGYDLIYKTNLDDIKNTIQLGRNDFSYGSKIVLDGSLYYQRLPGNWETKPEGIYAVGYARKAAVEGIVEDLSLLKETYGYYLLDEKGNHKLIKSLVLK